MYNRITVGVFLLVSLLAMKLVFTLVSTINELPLLPSLFQLVGLVVTAKFTINNINSEQRQATITSIKEQVQELGINDQVEAIKEVVSSIVGAVKATNITIPGWDKVDTSVPEDETNK